METARAVNNPRDLQTEIVAWTVDTYGTTHTARNIGSLGGHSGVTIGFDVVDHERLVERLVLKLPPPGVARKNNFDVLRQVPLLTALEAHGIAAPRARFWSDDEAAFGAPYLVMSRLAGSSPSDLFGPQGSDGIAGAHALFEQAIETLVAIHAIDTTRALAGWNAAREAEAEVEHWAMILKKSRDPAWLVLGQRVRALLHATMPRVMPRGLVHGDYYSNNWVFDGGRLSGVVDWEGASIGPSLLDLGWAYMIYDPASWGPMRRATMTWQPDPTSLVKCYAAHSKFDLDDLPWYRALAGYRLACITAYYFEEHRSGRRPNDVWEVFGESFPFLMQRAAALLEARKPG